MGPGPGGASTRRAEPAGDQSRNEKSGEPGGHALDLERRGVHPAQEVLEIVRSLELDADQRGSGLPVVLLHVLEHHDVLPIAQHLVKEVAKRTGLLGEGDEEVVPEALVEQRPLDDLAIAADVVVAARDDAHDRPVGPSAGAKPARAALASAPPARR